MTKIIFLVLRACGLWLQSTDAWTKPCICHIVMRTCPIKVWIFLNRSPNRPWQKRWTDFLVKVQIGAPKSRGGIIYNFGGGQIRTPPLESQHYSPKKLWGTILVLLGRPDQTPPLLKVQFGDPPICGGVFYYFGEGQFHQVGTAMLGLRHHHSHSH
jgi:hypothetical protein